ncbi:MAG TPA: carboxypeptidase-like regulatory domain-containing protein [Terracidiphilus sp.]|nr:carboxypeptidase-like regulatory domain-containing protein [Terracidiphilus sp.]
MAALAQSSESGSIAGKVTDLYSAPLVGVTVVARNEATGAEARTTTTKNGAYRFTGLEPGEYTLEAMSEQLGRGRVEGILVAAGHEARVQAAMRFELAPSTPVEAAVQAIKPATPALHPADKDLSARSPVAAAPLAAELPLPMAMSGRNSAELAREMPAAVTLVVTATLPEEPLLGLPLTGQGEAEVKPGVAGSGLAMSAAAGAAQAAIELNQPQPRPKRAISQNVDPVTPVVTTTVTAAELQALPASGRRWQDFVLDTPTAATAAGGASQTSLRGAGQEPAETTLDGASTRLAFGGTGGSGPGSSGPGSGGQGGAEQNGMGQAWAGEHGSQVAEAAIREVQTAAGNAEAEGARTAGGRMNVETQRGVNGLHGQGFFFDRQNTWGARNPFTQWVKETSPASTLYNSVPLFTSQSYTPPDHETVWGIGVGSQIRRDKFFWFAALDSYHRNDPGLSTVKHPYLVQYLSGCDVTPCPASPTPTGFFAQPSNDQMQVLSARLGLPSSNPVTEGLAAYSPMLETLAGLLGPAPRTAMQWTGFARLDWQAAERHRFTLEGIGANWNSPGGGLTRVEENYGTNSFGSSQASEEWLLGRWEAFLTPNLLAVTQGSLGHNVMSAHAESPPAGSFEQTLLRGNVYGQLPQIVVDNRYGFTIGNPSRFGAGSYPDERLYEGQERLDWVRGGLLVKAGFDLSHNFDATSLLRNQTGTYTYSNVENFVSDALVFAAFGLSGELNPNNQHNCDETGKVWRDSGGGLRGLGYLPCYSYYLQTMGPTNWHLSTNDWAGYVTAQWQAGKLLVFSAGLRWEREQLPPPIAKLDNPELPLTEKLPRLGNNWGPRLSMALGNMEGHWPVLRLGYGMYFGRTENATIETALTQTGSPHGDLNFFLRPTDNLNAGGAPPFPYVLAGEPSSMVKPGVVEFAPNFHNPEVHQAVAAAEEMLPGHVEVTASAMVSLGRRLPISIDTNFDPSVNPQTITYAVKDATGKGPIKATQITVPFYASWPTSTGIAGRLNPDYQQISEIMSRANSTYEAAMFKVVRYGRRGLSLHAHYTYAHAMDWNPNESTLVAGSDVLAPANFSQEYGTSNLDIRHSAAAMVIYEAPWKLRNLAGKVANGWMVSVIGQFHSGLPYTMRTSGSLAEEFNQTTGAAIVGLGPGINGSGGDNRVYGVGRNTYRYPSTWKADLRLGKRFDLGHMRELELLAESFNLFNHQNVTELETTGYYLESGTPSSPPTLNFLNGLKAGTTAFGQPLNINAADFYRERQIQVGLRMRF